MEGPERDEQLGVCEQTSRILVWKRPKNCQEVSDENQIQMFPLQKEVQPVRQAALTQVSQVNTSIHEYAKFVQVFNLFPSGGATQENELIRSIVKAPFSTMSFSSPSSSLSTVWGSYKK